MTMFFTAREQFVQLSALIEEPAHWRALADGDGTNADERTVAEFAASLQLLVGAPFKYLVPNNTMLPPESIRFFYVDENWVSALVDGALSLGRIGKVDTVHDQALSPVIDRRAETMALNRRRAQLQRATLDAPPEKPVFGGFLMRSALVSGWPGLEVQAFKSSTGSGINTKCSDDQVDLIRMDRLSNDVLLCLFAEEFGCVNIHEPKEGVNFGANPILPLSGGSINEAEPDKYTKQLRGLGIGGYPIAELIQGASIDVPLRTKRVIQVDALRQAMAAKLQSLQPPAWTAPAADFTSAQFSLQMIEGASQAVFRAGSTVAVPRVAAKRLAVAGERAADRKKLNAFLFGPDAEESA
jgi:hypothetical protein